MINLNKFSEGTQFKVVTGNNFLLNRVLRQPLLQDVATFDKISRSLGIILFTKSIFFLQTKLDRVNNLKLCQSIKQKNHI